MYRKTLSADGGDGPQEIDILGEAEKTNFGSLYPHIHQLDAYGPSSGTLDIEYQPVGSQAGTWRPVNNVQVDFADANGYRFEVVAEKFRITPTGVSGTYNVVLMGQYQN